MKTIILIGMMGSGKTTVGKFLAEKLNMVFIDTDNLIEQNENMTISEIFSTKGETYFRVLEKNIIKNTFKSFGMVISLGGGAYEDIQTRKFLSENTTVIYLKTEAETIFQRIKNDNTRPLLCDNMSVETIRNIVEKRKQNYESASLIITTDNRNPKFIAEEITGALK